MLSDHILYRHGFSDLEGVDITKRNLTLITIRASRVTTFDAGFCWDREKPAKSVVEKTRSGSKVKQYGSKIWASNLGNCNTSGRRTLHTIRASQKIPAFLNDFQLNAAIHF